MILHANCLLVKILIFRLLNLPKEWLRLELLHFVGLNSEMNINDFFTDNKIQSNCQMSLDFLGMTFDNLHER